MTRPIRHSKVLDTATLRAAGMRSIDHALNFGEDVNLATYDQQIKALQTQLYDYNTRLAELDERTAQITATEAALKGLSEKMLLGVRLRYGPSSLEYGLAGGTIRKSGGRSPKPDPASPTLTTDATVNAETPITNGHGTASVIS